MPLEYEHSFYNFNKDEIISKIKKNGFNLKGSFLFKVQIFKHPLNTEKTYIRVRDEGHRITLTFKLLSEKGFDNEMEVNVDNFDSTVNILEKLGCSKKYYYEKIREIWEKDHTEIVFDTNPGNPERMEVESTTKDDLNKILKILNLNSSMHDDSNKYMELFGIEIPKDIDLKFSSLEKDLVPHVKKNKELFLKLVKEQVKKYKNLFSKKKIKKYTRILKN
tara:strand:- start:279 stop:938 length:660 start_codon:yes stop_codon:yes gene_type:complete